MSAPGRSEGHGGRGGYGEPFAWGAAPTRLHRCVRVVTQQRTAHRSVHSVFQWDPAEVWKAQPHRTVSGILTRVRLIPATAHAKKNAQLQGWLRLPTQTQVTTKPPPQPPESCCGLSPPLLGSQCRRGGVRWIRGEVQLQTRPHTPHHGSSAAMNPARRKSCVGNATIEQDKRYDRG
jgi:hypothetical protein